MKFRQLALENVKGSWQRYLSFFLSSALSVAVFYLFSAFLNHPAVGSGYIRGGQATRTMLVVSEYLIMVFSFLFVLYSSSAFLTARKKEFGLLTLLGMTRTQLRKLVIYEDAAVAGTSILAGLGLGVLFSKLFFMAMAQFLHMADPIPFMIVWPAVLMTAGGFAAVFGVISILSALRVGRSKVISLLTASRKPKRPPVYSPLLSLFGVGLVGVGYYYAATSVPQTVGNRMIPVTVVVTLGTYFLFTQFSVAALRWLKRRRPVYYRNTVMLTVAQLVFRVRDNARLMFVVATLTAVVLTASGALYALYDDMARSVRVGHPQAVGWVESGANQHRVVDPTGVEAYLDSAGVPVDYSVSVETISGALSIAGGPQNTPVLLMSEADYNAVASKIDFGQPISVEPGEITYTRSGRLGPMARMFTEGKEVTLTANESGQWLTLTPQAPLVTVNPPPLGRQLFVIDSARYQELREGLPAEKVWTIYGYEFDNWLTHGPKLQQLVPANQQRAFVSRAPAYIYLKQNYALTVFVGVFVAVLFFVASGSMLYFKLFTELHEDRAYFEALRRIGISRPEARRVFGVQIALLFFVPFVVGMAHASFAMKALGNILRSSTVGYMLAAVLLFLSLQAAYFFLARRLYMGQVAGAPAPR